MILTNLIARPSKWSNRLAAAFVAGILMQSEAYAGDGFSKITKNIVTSFDNVPSAISTLSYIGGIGFGVAGVIKLKQHVDNPQNAPLKEGLIRLIAGGGLLALPAVFDAMTGSIGTSGSTPSVITVNDLSL